MQTTIRKTETKAKPKEKTSKDDATPLSKKPQEDKLKRSVYSVSTPRNYVQKSSTADIYAQKKKSIVQATKAPKKVLGTTHKSSDVSPMKDQLKSSASSVSQISQVSAKKVKSTPVIKTQGKTPSSARNATPRTGKDLPVLNVTVNSPVAKRKIENKDGRTSNAENARKVKNGGQSSMEEARKVQDGGRSSTDPQRIKESARNSSETEPKSSNAKRKSGDSDSKEVGDRQRTKTRTLNDNEVKVLTPDAVDNNAEMQNLSRRLTAKPKAFYVDLDDSKEKVIKAEKSSEEEIDYEDDFESYESDFESPSPSGSDPTDHDTDDQTEEGADHDDDNDDDAGDDAGDEGGDGGDVGVGGDEAVKEGRDEEKMLDSGNFDLRDTRSANKAKPGMAHIPEAAEAEARSLTDEGFQEMSSAGCSVGAGRADGLERPLFIDFTRAKANKRKRKIFERLKQRAHDILSMVTLHEMTYALFEMKPIPYDLYMATFGRSNYMQTASQTFDDGITEEVQTDEVVTEERWTQHPVEFSKHDIYLKGNKKTRKYSNSTEDFVSKFTFLVNKKSDDEINNRINTDEDYKANPLRVYFEQKDGAGPAEMLPYENYKNKLGNNDFNATKLRKFLKKHESRISNILSANTGSSEAAELTKSSKYLFSKGYVSVTTKHVTNEEFTFLKQAKVTGVVFSESKSNLILTIHTKCDILDKKCVMCLWDLSVARMDPIKVLVAIDDVNIGRFKGNTDGIFVAALNDGSIHLWDLSEEPTWHPDVASAEKTTNLVEVEPQATTQTEMDREWNLKNSHVGCESATPQCVLRASSFTTSATHVSSDDTTRHDAAAQVVGLELNDTGLSHDVGRKVIGQVCSLQRIGILTIWSIIQEKRASDMGKAYWSKMRLELNQTIFLIDHLDLPRTNSDENIHVPPFNLNAAKRRTSVRRKEKNLKKQLTRQKSAVKSDSDRPSSAASVKNQILPQNSWESGIECNDLKIMRLGVQDQYLVGKNCGEVLCCTRNAGVFKINRFCVATDSSTVTSVDVSPHCLPYFLAGTDSGTVNLCSMLESRVLLTLDCRNGPPSSEVEKYNVDPKGRYVGSAPRPHSGCPTSRLGSKVAVKSVSWSHLNPCSMLVLTNDGTLFVWDLTTSDIYARHVNERAASSWAHGDDKLGWLATAPLLVWDLTTSDIHARHVSERAATSWAHADDKLALITSEGEVQVHRLGDERHTKEYLELFQKYIALL